MKTFRVDSLEVHSLMNVLIKEGNNFESISVMLDKSFSTIYDWYRGKRKPGKGDYELLRTMAEKAVIKEED